MEHTNSVLAPATVKHVVLYKHGIGYFSLEARVQGTVTLRMQFKASEMDDALKSLIAADVSSKGFISTISYDAAQDISKVLADLSVSLPAGSRVLEDLLADLAGATVAVEVGGSEMKGTLVGVEPGQAVDTSRPGASIIDNIPDVVLIEGTAGTIRRVSFRDVRGIRILNDDLQKDLAFYLDAIISQKQTDVKNIIIHCVADTPGSDERTIHVSHVREVPAWKTSYRLVLPGDTAAVERKDTAMLHGFGLVDNQTTQDWSGVTLVLVAGQPVSFRYPIFEPQYITRKVVPLPAKASIGPASIEDTVEMDRFMDARPSTRKGRPSLAAAPAPATRDDAAADMARMEESIKQSIKVSTKDAGELFEYRITTPVTIERNRSALVPILSGGITARKVLLFDTANHPTNPFACAEITNSTGLVLEAGPVTIAIDDSLAGEAMLPYLNKDETRMLNYALEQAVVVTIEEKRERTNVHKVSVRRGTIYEHAYEMLRTTYIIKNKASSKKVLYIDQHKQSGFKVIESPVEAKETPSRWRFSIDLEPKLSRKVEVVTRKEMYESFTLSVASKTYVESRLSFLVENGLVDVKVKDVIEQIAGLNATRAMNEKQQRDLEAERKALDADQARLRETLKVLGTARAEVDLKERLVKQLGKQEARYEEIKRRVNDIGKENDALAARIAGLVASIDAA